MMLTIHKEPYLDDDYVEIRYRELTPELTQIIEICNRKTTILLGEEDGKKYTIDCNDIYYIEWVDTRSCICTANKIFSTPFTLAQLEQQLAGTCFVRITKPMLVNVYKVRWISTGLNMKMVAELVNGEKVAVSRHYRNNLINAIYSLGKE